MRKIEVYINDSDFPEYSDDDLLAWAMFVMGVWPILSGGNPLRDIELEAEKVRVESR